MTTPSMRLLAANAPAAGGFLPTDIADCVGWWDASNTGSITSSGSDCTQWADLSGGGYHFTQGTTGKYPQTGTATINSLNVLSFDGTADSMSVTSYAGLNGSADMTVFYVVESAATGDRVVLEMTANYTSTAGFVSFQTSATRYLSSGISSPPVFNQYRTSAISNATPYVLSWTADRASTDPENRLWLNGTVDNTAVNTGNTSGTFSTTGLFLGSRNNASLFWSGKIAEIVVYAAVLDSTNRQTVEDYLGPKWGVTIA